jgi:hypothetical protein
MAKGEAKKVEGHENSDEAENLRMAELLQASQRWNGSDSFYIRTQEKDKQNRLFNSWKKAKLADKGEDQEEEKEEEKEEEQK